MELHLVEHHGDFWWAPVNEGIIGNDKADVAPKLAANIFWTSNEEF